MVWLCWNIWESFSFWMVSIFESNCHGNAATYPPMGSYFTFKSINDNKKHIGKKINWVVVLFGCKGHIHCGTAYGWSYADLSLLEGRLTDKEHGVIPSKYLCKKMASICLVWQLYSMHQHITHTHTHIIVSITSSCCIPVQLATVRHPPWAGRLS